MAREAVSMDLTEINMPSLVRLTQEVRRIQLPSVLHEGGEDVAVLTPATAKHRPKPTTPR